MILDARQLPNRTRLAAEVCVVGAGPAGLVVARGLAARGIDVLVLESGGIETDPRSRDPDRGEVVGDLDPSLAATRARGVGGTATSWNTPVWGADGPRRRGSGAKYLPLDPVDFEGRGGEPDGGWPFDASELADHYRAAHELCGLGRPAYEGDAWSDAARPLLALAGDRLTTRVYQFGSSDRFTSDLPLALRTSGEVRLCLHATAVEVVTDGSGREAGRVRIATSTGGELTAEARFFVLAAGAIENARLLLVSPGGGGTALGNRHGWLGRCLMEHPRDRSLLLVPRSRDLIAEAGFYDPHAAADGTVVCGRLALRGGAVREERLPNASASLFPVTASGPEGRDGSAVGLPRRWLAALRRRFSHRYDGGYGWSRVPDPAAAFRGFRLLLNVEQRPHRENRVALAGARDALGMPRVRVTWRWREEDRAALDRLRRVVAEELELSGLGRVRLRDDVPIDPDAHHHSGTTRMHADPRRGVVDPDSRVHGTDNLYVAGASVFPSSGFANPTLTIVALAARLAEHLADRS